jgi:hypothetical protein
MAQVYTESRLRYRYDRAVRSPFRDPHEAARVAEERAAEERAIAEAEAAQQTEFARRLRARPPDARSKRLFAVVSVAGVLAIFAALIAWRAPSAPAAKVVPSAEALTTTRPVTTYPHEVRWPGTPALAHEAVTNVVHARANELDACYVAARASGALVVARIDEAELLTRFSWIIEADGRVSRIWPDSVLKPGTPEHPLRPDRLAHLPALADGEGTTFERCVVSRIHDWVFPASTGPTHVEAWGFASCVADLPGGATSCLSHRAPR